MELFSSVARVSADMELPVYAPENVNHPLWGSVFVLTPNTLDAPAAAVECIHAYSLIHDDLPAMDELMNKTATGTLTQFRTLTYLSKISIENPEIR